MILVAGPGDCAVYVPARFPGRARDRVLADHLAVALERKTGVSHYDQMIRAASHNQSRTRRLRSVTHPLLSSVVP